MIKSKALVLVKLFIKKLNSLNMFGLFKQKTEKEKLMILYKKKKEKAFQLSKKSRKESDKMEKEAHDILLQIDNVKSK
tara:strand:+ start:370 stop:603 length:234 start_codon:yes stop_codon:yes gene_type:complete